MKLRTKILIGLAAIFAISLLVFAAGPPPGTFLVPSFFTTNGAKIYGTNGITVSSNPPTGIYLIDGFNLTNGFSGGSFIATSNGFGTNTSFYVDWTNFGTFHFGITARSIDQFGGFALSGGTFAGTISDTSFGNWAINSDGSGIFGVGAAINWDNAGNMNGGDLKWRSLRTTGNITNDSLTADTLIRVDTSKAEISIPNAAGALTNNGSGGANIGWYNGFASTGYVNSATQTISIALSNKIDELNGLGTNTIFYSTATNIPAVRVVGFSNDYENVALLVDTTNGSRYTVLGLALNGTNSGRLTVDPTLNFNIFNELNGGTVRIGANYQDIVDNGIEFGHDGNTLLPRWSMVGTDIYPGDSSTYTIGLGTALLEVYLPGGGAQAQINTKHPKFSVWSNGVEIVGLGLTTNFDFYGFTLLTNANGKVSLGAPISTATSGINVQSNAFGGTVGSGTNLLFLTSSNLLLTATNTATAGGTNSVSHDTAQGITTKSSPTFQNIGISTDASVSNHLAIGVNNTATNYLAAYKTRFFALTNATGGWGDWMAASPMPTRRDWFWVQDNGVGIGVMGVQSAASIGTAGHVEATTNEWPAFSYTTGAALLSSNGISSALSATTLGMFPGKNLYFSYVGRVTLMSTQRVWIGYSSATTATMGANSDTPTTSHVAAIRLSSAAAGALTNWAFVTCDGSACTVNAGGPVSLTTTNVHVFEIMEDRPNVRWLAYVDGICIGTNTANLPISGMKYIAMVSTLEAVAKAIKGNAVYGEMDNRNNGNIILNP